MFSHPRENEIGKKVFVWRKYLGKRRNGETWTVETLSNTIDQGGSPTRQFHKAYNRFQWQKHSSPYIYSFYVWPNELFLGVLFVILVIFTVLQYITWYRFYQIFFFFPFLFYHPLVRTRLTFLFCHAIRDLIFTSSFLSDGSQMLKWRF